MAGLRRPCAEFSGRRDLRRPLRFGECNPYALHFNLAELRHMDVPHAEAACG